MRLPNLSKPSKINTEKEEEKEQQLLPNWATLDVPFRETHLGVPPMMPPVWTSTGCSRQERRTGGLRVARCATLRNPSGRPTSAADRTQPTDRPTARPKAKERRQGLRERNNPRVPANPYRIAKGFLGFGVLLPRVGENPQDAGEPGQTSRQLFA